MLCRLLAMSLAKTAVSGAITMFISTKVSLERFSSSQARAVWWGFQIQLRNSAVLGTMAKTTCVCHFCARPFIFRADGPRLPGRRCKYRTATNVVFLLPSYEVSDQPRNWTVLAPLLKTHLCVSHFQKSTQRVCLLTKFRASPQIEQASSVGDPRSRQRPSPPPSPRHTRGPAQLRVLPPPRPFAPSMP